MEVSGLMKRSAGPAPLPRDLPGNGDQSLISRRISSAISSMVLMAVLRDS